LLNLGIAYFKMRNFQKSKYFFSKSLNFQKDNCLAHSYLGRSYLELKDFPKASEQLDKAVGFCQRSLFDEPHYYSALAYLQIGKRNMAEARLEELIKLYPNGKYLEKAKSMLQGMRR
jgi:type IV pilus assembly protein PilF